MSVTVHAAVSCKQNELFLQAYELGGLVACSQRSYSSSCKRLKICPASIPSARWLSALVNTCSW
jgi:hypothetical protein